MREQSHFLHASLGWFDDNDDLRHLHHVMLVKIHVINPLERSSFVLCSVTRVGYAHVDTGNKSNNKSDGSE